MPVKVNPKWLEEHFAKFLQKHISDGEYFVVTSHLPAVRSLCVHLADRNIPYDVINMPGGVKKITNQTNVCKKCSGTGRC